MFRHRRLQVVKFFSFFIFFILSHFSSKHDVQQYGTVRPVHYRYHLPIPIPCLCNVCSMWFCIVLLKNAWLSLEKIKWWKKKHILHLDLNVLFWNCAKLDIVFWTCCWEQSRCCLFCVFCFRAHGFHFFGKKRCGILLAPLAF